MAEVSLDGVRKIYPGGVEAVRGVSLAVADGSLCVLVGPSGCGKSTLLRMIAGLETITAGEVRIGGRVVNNLEPAERDIAMVFQNYALYPHMSVYGNMAYGLRNRGASKPEIDRRVRQAAELLGITAFLERRPGALSGGQRQRVAMGRAIVRDPQVFLFDEPLSNLDAKLRGSMRIEIKKLQRRLATTSVYVTHDQLEAMTLADQLVVMNAGLIEQAGPPLELYARPATTFVAGFLGAPPMNLLPLERAADAIILAGGSDPLGGTSPPPPGGTLGVRPEDLAPVRPDAEPAAGIAIDVAVDAVEAVGPEAYLHGRAGDCAITVRLPTGAAPQPGDVFRVGARPDRLHFFDRDGRRV